VTATAPVPTELRFVPVADVYKRGRLAAHLRREVTGVTFEYRDDYLADPDAPAVATTLPRSSEQMPTGSAGAVPPFFAGLLPEGRRLSALQRAVKTSADDDLTLLLAVGQDIVGDVEVVASGTQPSYDRASLDVVDWSDVSFAALYSQLSGERLDPTRAGLAGVQAKVSARLINLPVRRAGDRFILKVNPPEFPHLVENEHFFLGAARRSGLTVADAEIVHDGDAQSGLLVRRFDRVGGDNAVRMLAQEDACQVLGRYPADKYNVSAEDVARGLAHITQARPVAARDLVRQFAFAYLTGNGDAHAKNFSIVQSLDDEWRVAPAYDIPSSYLYGDATMALPINGKLDEGIGRADFVAFGDAYGVRPRATERVLDDLVERVDTWLPDVAGLPFDARVLHKLRRNVEYRRGRLSAGTTPR
jgi:serine/threonine-protein kinase HipA